MVDHSGSKEPSPLSETTEIQADDQVDSSASLMVPAVSGAVWGSAQVLVSKGLQFTGMLVLAWFVSQEELGVASIALSISTFVVLLNPIALGDYLIQRTPLAIPAIRSVLVVGCVAGIISGVVVTVAAPQIGAVWASTGVVLPLVILAWKPLADTLAIVPQAVLRYKLRFKEIAFIDIVSLALGTSVSVGLALAGMGAVSIVAPLLVTALLRAAAYSSLLKGTQSHRGADRNLGSSKWHEPSHQGLVLLLAAQYVHSIVNIVDWPIVGAFRSASDLGLYYFAWNLSIQGNTVLSSQFGQTLQPVLVRMRAEPGRQGAAFIRALRVLGAVAVPVSLMQAALAIPLFHLLFGTKWDMACLGFMALSIGQAFAFSIGPVLAVIKAQGRFTLLLSSQLLQLGFAIAVMTATAWLTVSTQQSSLAIGLLAIASASQFVLFCPFLAWLAAKPLGVSPFQIFRVFATPFLAALPIAVGVWVVAGWADTFGPFARAVVCVVSPIVGAAVYYNTLKWIDKELCRELLEITLSISRTINNRFIRRGLGD